jgi:hypothetical protein
MASGAWMCFKHRSCYRQKGGVVFGGRLFLTTPSNVILSVARVTAMPTCYLVLSRRWTHSAGLFFRPKSL